MNHLSDGACHWHGLTSTDWDEAYASEDGHGHGLFRVFADEAGSRVARFHNTLDPTLSINDIIMHGGLMYAITVKMEEPVNRETGDRWPDEVVYRLRWPDNRDIEWLVVVGLTFDTPEDLAGEHAIEVVDGLPVDDDELWSWNEA